MGCESTLQTIRSAKRKRLLFGYKNLYSQMSGHSEAGLQKLESEGGYKFPIAVKDALVALGGCAIDDLYIHPYDRIYRFDEQNGDMSGCVAFASDIFGNYFAFNPISENPNEIYYYSHDPIGYASVAPDFLEYLKAFVASGFKTVELTAELELIEPA